MVYQDWHTKQCLMQVIWKQLYSLSSGSDVGTLYQLRNRRNVVKDPKNNMNACEDFILDVTDAQILVAFMTELGLSSVEETPTRLIPLKSCDSFSQRSALLDETGQLVDKYVDLALKTDLASTSKLKDDDHVLNYARDTLTYGLLLKEFNDAIHEGMEHEFYDAGSIFYLYFRQPRE